MAYLPRPIEPVPKSVHTSHHECHQTFFRIIVPRARIKPLTTVLASRRDVDTTDPQPTVSKTSAKLPRNRHTEVASAAEDN